MPAPAPYDPLDAVLRPPIDESPDEKQTRLAKEAEALRISHEIDEQIKRERVQRKKRQVVRLLLLGQSESGKSTTLRQFQRLYTPSAFREERILWRAVVQLNVVRSVRTILDALADVRRRGPPSSASDENYNENDDEDEDEDDGASERVRVPAHLDALSMRLLPLRHTEALLIAQLVPPSESEAAHLGFCAADADADGYRAPHHRPQQHNEIFVRPGAAWKAGGRGAARLFGRAQAQAQGEERADESQQVLHALREDIVALWRDRTVREVLRRRKIRLEESPGFFLDDLDRIARLDYCPSDSDVFKARLKTVGVCEYKFEMEAGFESGTEWRIIDVGGSRSQVPRWVPYFDDAIIFLVPISAFDQTLVEDKSVNRLEDSVYLWKAVCANALLAKVELILFMNKCDILERKLRSGIRLARYLRSFGDRPNDLENAQKFFRSKFSFIHREHSPLPRKFHGYATSVTDASTTSGILVSVRDMVMREHLRKAKLLP